MQDAIDRLPHFLEVIYNRKHLHSRDGNEDIFVMNADGSDVTQLTFNSANDAVPVWRAQPLPPPAN